MKRVGSGNELPWTDRGWSCQGVHRHGLQQPQIEVGLVVSKLLIAGLQSICSSSSEVQLCRFERVEIRECCYVEEHS